MSDDTRTPPGDPAPPFGLRLGAVVDGTSTHFRVWAPEAESIAVVLEAGERRPMTRRGGGTFDVSVEDVRHGDLYRIELDGAQVFPDPASRFQPEGVHGPSMVIDPARFIWTESYWDGIALPDLIFYELHTGTFSPEGTFEGVHGRLSFLHDLGVTALELMPVAEFPGRWNWGYDHAALYAPSRAYGTPDDLRTLVDGAHSLGMAVFLDVIFNHLGPDGAYVAAVAPMFTERHTTPWGRAINLDDRHAEGVRRLFIDNALMWLTEYHFDGLRLDATHALIDDSDPHFLSELKEAVEQIDEGPARILIAEDHRNDHRLLLPREEGGYQLDAVWADDFHHQMRNLTAGDDDGYYVDYAGTTTADLAATINRGWFYDGRISTRTGAPRGTDPSPIRPEQCVVCIQNHDQVGNRPSGRRLHHDIRADLYRAASAVLLFVPELPLLFMGQEWAASTPFLFFTDHDEPLGSLVSEGRKQEFSSFEGFRGTVPDPQDSDTYFRSRLNWAELDEEHHARMLELYRDLVHLRPHLPAEIHASAEGSSCLRIRRGRIELLASFRGGTSVRPSEGSSVVLHTEDAKYATAGRAPELADDRVRFPVPSAIVLAS
jgi:maltooligosyltrehalose trehalohydrolase